MMSSTHKYDGLHKRNVGNVKLKTAHVVIVKLLTLFALGSEKIFF